MRNIFLAKLYSENQELESSFQDLDLKSGKQQEVVRSETFEGYTPLPELRVLKSVLNAANEVICDDSYWYLAHIFGGLTDLQASTDLNSVLNFFCTFALSLK